MSGSRIVEVAQLDFAYLPAPWPFAEERRAEIGEHWAKRTAAQPSLFNGRVLLLGRHEFAVGSDGAVLRGDYFETDFNAFLAWRDFGFPDRTVCNGFSMAALQASDGAFLLGEMSAHTMNAGAIYFAAGTPDPSDIVGDRVDLGLSVMREMTAETGLLASEVAAEPGWVVVYAPPRIACMKITRVAEIAERLKARIEANLAADPQSELVRMHIARDARDIDEKRMPAFIVDFLRHAFGER
jgi:hypothetical protein